jgi:hypothetical protein
MEGPWQFVWAETFKGEKKELLLGHGQNVYQEQKGSFSLAFRDWYESWHRTTDTFSFLLSLLQTRELTWDKHCHVLAFSSSEIYISQLKSRNHIWFLRNRYINTWADQEIIDVEQLTSLTRAKDFGCSTDQKQTWREGCTTMRYTCLPYEYIIF